MANVNSSLKNIIIANKRRSAGTLTEQEYLDAIKFFGGKCAYSGTELSENNLHLDHIIPVTMGGTTDKWNSLPVCGTCNTSKHDKHLLDWWDANRKAEDEYRLEKVLYYMLGCLVQNKKLKLSTGKGKTKTLDTWQFSTHLLNHLMENKEYLKVTRKDIESGKVDILGDKEYESYITSRSVDQRLETYGRVLSGLYKRESRKSIDLKEVYKTQNELVDLLKKLKVENHYTIAFDLYDKVYERYQTESTSAVDNLKRYLVELSDYFKSYDKSAKIGNLINRNPNLLVMPMEEVKGKMESLSTSLGSPEFFINQVEYLNYSKAELKDLINYCNLPQSKISFEQLSISFFKYQLSVDEIKQIIDEVNRDYKEPVILGYMSNFIYGKGSINLEDNLKKFIDEQSKLYEKNIIFWDAYLKAEKRQNNNTSKVVVQSDEYYKIKFGASWEEEKKRDIVRCLNGIMQTESFQGEKIGVRLGVLKQGNNKSLLAFWNKYYGVDFAEDAGKIQKEDLKKIEQVCGKLGIKFTGAIKEQSIYEFEDKINFIAENYGREYLTDATIGKSIEELQTKLSYLKTKGILYGVLTDPEILRLTTEQIEERLKILKLLDRPVVIRDKKTNEEKLNFVFSATPKAYQDILQRNKINPSTIDEQLARKFNSENV